MLETRLQLESTKRASVRANGAAAPAARTILQIRLQNSNYAGRLTSKCRGAAAAFTKRLKLIRNAGLRIGHESKPAAIPHGAPKGPTLACACKLQILNLPQIVRLKHSATLHLKPMQLAKILQEKRVGLTLLLSRRAREYCELRRASRSVRCTCSSRTCTAHMHTAHAHCTCTLRMLEESLWDMHCAQHFRALRHRAQVCDSKIRFPGIFKFNFAKCYKYWLCITLKVW